MCATQDQRGSTVIDVRAVSANRDPAVHFVAPLHSVTVAESCGFQSY